MIARPLGDIGHRLHDAVARRAGLGFEGKAPLVAGRRLGNGADRQDELNEIHLDIPCVNAAKRTAFDFTQE
jgi:epoxyqueuosine reductase QueG